MLHRTEPNELNGIFSKIHKLHKKITKPLKKALPKPLRKIHEKIDGRVEKLANNKKLNQVGNIAAAAVATYFTGGAAAPLLKAQIQKVVVDKQKAADKKELQKLQGEVLQAQQSYEASSQNSVNETLTPNQQDYVKQQVAQKGTAAFQEPQVIEMLRPAIQKTSGEMAVASFSASSPLPPEMLQEAGERAGEIKVDQAATRSFIQTNWPIFAVVGAGAIFLYMNRRK